MSGVISCNINYIIFTNSLLRNKCKTILLANLSYMLNFRRCMNGQVYVTHKNKIPMNLKLIL